MMIRVLLLSLFLSSHFAYAQTNRSATTPKKNPVKRALWNFGPQTVVKIKASAESPAVTCEKFDVERGESIQFNVKCGATEEQKLYLVIGKEVNIGTKQSQEK